MRAWVCEYARACVRALCCVCCSGIDVSLCQISGDGTRGAVAGVRANFSVQAFDASGVPIASGGCELRLPRAEVVESARILRPEQPC